MSSFEQQLHKYAELVLKVGVNLQPGQVLCLLSRRSRIGSPHLPYF
ncbi:leucyl aminopeptidase (aminopeptidase T) [Brevibacillus nitrificans]|nr:leucyl aminopeptidase (aminopeptidase T) [Brevibacillus nitrificans]